MNATRLINVSNRLPIVIDKDGEDRDFNAHRED